MPSVSSPQNIRKRHGIYRKVVLVDLDLTLFDYSNIRKRAARRVISSMSLNVPIEKAFDLYEWIVEHSRSFQAIGFQDFRHFWNSPQLYGVLVSLSKIDNHSLSKFCKEIEEIEDEAAELKGNDKLRKLELARTKPEIRRFLNQMQKIENDQSIRKIIGNALKNFNILTAKMPLFEDAEDFLRSLHNAGIEQYIVTEGKKRIQMEKFRKLGLQRLIDPNKVLVVVEKKPSSFFKVLVAIQNCPDSPRKYLEECERRKNMNIQGRSIKLAVIGDRYDKDVAPLKELFGDNVITIRLLCGKYFNKYSIKELKMKGLPLPSLMTKNLSEAKRFLLSEHVWRSVTPIDLQGKI